MAMEYFLAYHSYLKSIEPLSDAERGRLFTAMLEYSITGAEPELRGAERYIFPTMKVNIDRDVAKYNAKCQAQSLNGKKGGRPQKPKNPRLFSESQKSQKSQDKDKEKEKDKEEDKEEDKPLRGNSARGAQELPNVSDFAFSAELEAAVNEWLAYKRERKDKPYTPVGLKSLLSRIKKSAAEYGDAAVVETIQESMGNMYMGIVFDRLKKGGNSGAAGRNNGESAKPRRDWGITYDV